MTKRVEYFCQQCQSTLTQPLEYQRFDFDTKQWVIDSTDPSKLACALCGDEEIVVKKGTGRE